METMEWTFRDTQDPDRFAYRDQWPAGPWDSEPDKVQWEDPATKLPCLAVRNRTGAWCGYVGLPVGHPWRELNYDAIPANVHGGLTFGPTPCSDDKEGICHTVDDPAEDDVRWIGFDCLHFGDTAPGMMANDRRLNKKLIAEGREPIMPDGKFLYDERDDGPLTVSYKPLAYAKAETTLLAAQAYYAESDYTEI